MVLHAFRTSPLGVRLQCLPAFVLLTCALSTFFNDPVHATTAAGRTRGTFAVSATGAATYTIPIWSPPGPNGMQPNIALVYNSQQGNGYVGVGWSISGLSAIYRCNQTFAQDGAAAPVSLSTSDGYCMDGQRLLLTGGTYGTTGSTYQTEVANFLNVTASGSVGNGPAYFTAQDRNGRTYTYGKGNSQVLANGTAVSWMLNEVSDPAGNTMAISYTTANGTAVPGAISWTPISYGSGSYSYTMTFSYGNNPSNGSGGTGRVCRSPLPHLVPPVCILNGYVGGAAVSNGNLLSSITIAYEGSVIKNYILGYTLSSTSQRKTLTSIQECATTDTSNCMTPTTITYQPGAQGVSTTAKSAVSGAKTVYSHYDLNGDGYTDLIYSNGTTWYVAFGSASGYGTPVSTGITASTPILPGDLLGSGKAGILANNGGTFYYYTWNGSSFTSSSTDYAYSSSSQYVLADTSGNGLPNLVVLQWGSSGASVEVSQNTSSGGSVRFGAPAGGFSVSPASLGGCTTTGAQIASGSDQASTFGTLHNFDFNGDGRQDVVLWTVVTHSNNGAQCTAPFTNDLFTFALVSSGSSSTTFSGYQLVSFNSVTTTIPPPPIYFLDWNSDGCTDVYTQGTIVLSGCNGSTPTTVAVPGTVIGAMDWNGDGLTDLLVQNGSTVGVYLSTGSGAPLPSQPLSTSIPYTSSNTYFTFDANGDGLDDLAYVTSSGTVGYYLHQGVGTPPDLLSSVTDGFGNSASPTYVSLVQSNYTQSTDATYPYQNYIGPMYVVSQATISDPSSASGGTYSQTFIYAGAWTNLQGRGWQSFYYTRAYDTRNQTYQYQYFARSFPYAGMLSAESLTTSNLADFVQVENTLTALTLSGSGYPLRQFPYVSSTTTSKWEVGGPEAGDLITSTTANFTFDNYGNATNITRTVTDNDPGYPSKNPYEGDTWTTTTTNHFNESTPPCVTLLSTSEVQYTASTTPASTSVTFNKTYTPNTTLCNYTQIVTQPNTPYAVTEGFGYDSFGNINSDTVTGTGMTARLTSANWGATGQFINTLTDPSGALTTWTYNSTQSLGFGVPDKITDANNLPTSWVYDGFGRKIQETRPDNTYTVWTYQNCSGTSGCLVGTNGLVVGQTVYNNDHSYQSSGTSYLDSVGRPLVENQVMLSGSYARAEVRYDSLGRVMQKALPCTWTSLTTTCTYWTTNAYDSLNRLVETERPINASSGPTACNPTTVPPASGCQGTSYSYAGRTTTVTDPYSMTKTILTDVNGWPRQTTDPYGYTITLAYDAAGNKTGVTDSLANTLWSGTYNYGLAAYLASSTDIDMGTWNFTVDALGEVTGWTDAKKQSFSATYDALSRLRTRSEPDTFTQWTYGSSAPNFGKRTAACTGTGTNPTNCTSNPSYSETESYDSLGRLSNRAITNTGLAGTSTYTLHYNATTGFLDTLTYPASEPSTYSLEVQYRYSNGILQSVTDISDTPNVTVWTANAMNPAGQVTEETLGNLGTGIVTNRSYDAVTGWLGSVQSGVGGGSAVKNLSFMYDDMGDVIQRQDNNLGLTENVYYDNDYRFSHSMLNGTQNLSLTYDSMGNITSRSDVAGGATWTYSSTKKHEVTQAGSSAYQYGYDANGNVTSRQGSGVYWTSYNYPNQILSGSGSTAEHIYLSYGPDRQRIKLSYYGNPSSEMTYYVGKELEVVNVGGGVNYRHYIYAGSEPVAVYSRTLGGTDTLSYFISDHQGSVADLTNSSGASVVNESFTPFGMRRNPSTWSGAASTSDITTSEAITRQGYTFQTQLGVWSGLNHMNGRVQDAMIGRMLSADPNVPDPTNTQSYNRYSYVNNNPVTNTDPTGFAPFFSTCDASDEVECENEGPDPTGPGNNDGSSLLAAQDVTIIGARLPNLWWQPSLQLWGLQTQIDNMFPELAGGANGGAGKSQGTTPNSQGKPPCDQSLIDLGNLFANGAEAGGTAGLRVEEIGGLLVAGGAITGNEIAFDAGAALAGTGGAMTTTASLLQAIAGGLQWAGGDSSTGQSNLVNGGGLFVSSLTLMAIVNQGYNAGFSAAQRLFNSRFAAASAVGGLLFDATASISPQFAPQRATCPSSR